ncbi:MAG TPA: hypothetical protein HA330_03110 [Candidatus Thalassarchaeaceae archaeon]|nr:hypothetical protein [Candidatus Thalassarchaeaceae archaeon]|tara:strand:+ start:1687 stop:2055 length:369 start_codon:yes stop_codon:yes gene_type:complete
MATSIEITKATLRERVVVDVNVWMDDPEDHDFSPRAHMSEGTLHIHNAGQDDISSTFDLEEEMLVAAERDRLIELRVKFGVHGMHGTLTHKTPLPRTGPNAKKLAESRWKTLLPLEFPPKSR